MKNSVRSIVLVAVLALTVSPTLRAEQGGANPHPQVVSDQVSALQIVAYTVINLLGF